MVLHAGDFDYADDPALWEAFINTTLGPTFPYFAAGGNHDMAAWRRPSLPSYEKVLYDRLLRMGANVTCRGEVGLNMVCAYKGLVFITSSYGATLPQCYSYCTGAPISHGHTAFIDRAFDTYPAMWKVCMWHKNHRLMQIGMNTSSIV